MSKYPYRQDREELKALLQQFENLKSGKSNSFLEEDSFERIIDYFDENEQLSEALEAAEYGIQQYPYSSLLLLKKADLLIALRQYKEALIVLDEAELLDSKDTNLYILKTDAYLALDQQQKAAAVLEAAIADFGGEEKIDLLFELADVYDDYENFEKVFDCLKMILEQEPNNEEALYKMGITGIDPKLVTIIGRLKYRTSYGQNVLNHSMEVGYVAASMAAELGLDTAKAKKCGFFHDLGKSVDHETEGSHPELGFMILKKFNM